MKLGVFDSGLGGLLMSKAIRERLPGIDMVYFGDTLHLPYGNRSQEAIYGYTRRAMEFLFRQDCKLIVIACNTASATALRKLQQEWLPYDYPDRRILGVVVPTLESAAESGYRSIGLLGTSYTVHSDVYGQELKKLDPGICLKPIAAPLLVPLIENDGMEWVEPALARYLKGIDKNAIDALILGCTHYPLIKTQIEQQLPGIPQISQDEIVPPQLENYLERHPEIASTIGQGGNSEFFVSDITEGYKAAARRLYGHDIHLQKAEIPL